MAEGKGKLVCVTGVSGFIGSHVMRQLLERGYRVRGTVRDAGNESKTAWIRDLAKGTPGTLELVTANLVELGSFDAAVAGCELVVHAATVVQLGSKDPQKDIVDPAVDGTKNVFSSILKAKCAKRVVVTSSIAAVAGFPPIPGHVYTEADWNETATLREPYYLAKTMAEKLAWKTYEEQPSEGWRFELVTIQPGYVLGPVYNKQHLRSSPQLVQQLLNGQFPMAPQFRLGLVHVRDVALAHVAALENPAAKGRYILSLPQPQSTLEMADILREDYPKQKLPTKAMPNLLMYVAALFHPSLTWDALRILLGPPPHFSGEKASQELGTQYASGKEALLDTAKSIVDQGLLHAKP